MSSQASISTSTSRSAKGGGHLHSPVTEPVASNSGRTSVGAVGGMSAIEYEQMLLKRGPEVPLKSHKKTTVSAKGGGMDRLDQIDAQYSKTSAGSSENRSSTLFSLSLRPWTSSQKGRLVRENQLHRDSTEIESFIRDNCTAPTTQSTIKMQKSQQLVNKPPERNHKIKKAVSPSRAPAPRASKVARLVLPSDNTGGAFKLDLTLKPAQPSSMLPEEAAVLCHSSDSVRMLKGTIEALLGIPAAIQRLSLLRGSEQLELEQDDQNIGALGGGPGSRVLVQTSHVHAAHNLASQMLAAATAGDVATVRSLLKSNCQIDSPSTTDGSTALHMAAQYGHASVITLLCANGCARDLADDQGNTPLHLAVISLENSSNLQPLSLLLTSGADPLLANDQGKTPFHVALSSTLIPDRVAHSVLELIIQRCINVCIQDMNQVSSHAYAESTNKPLCAALLVQQKQQNDRLAARKLGPSKPDKYSGAVLERSLVQEYMAPVMRVAPKLDFKKLASVTQSAGGSFGSMEERNTQMDLSEFLKFCKDFGLLGLLGVRCLKEIFRDANLAPGADTRRGSLNLHEFVAAADACLLKVTEQLESTGEQLPELVQALQAQLPELRQQDLESTKFLSLIKRPKNWLNPDQGPVDFEALLAQRA